MKACRKCFPDVESITGAYRFFTVHLDEEIGKSGRRLTERRLSDWGLEATASPLPREAYNPADGPYRWISGRPPRADLEQSDAGPDS
jgi:hypothetical protein